VTKTLIDEQRAKEPRGAQILRASLLRSPYAENEGFMIIGVSGLYGSGKGALLAELGTRGYEILSLSDVVRDELAKDGLDETRERMIAAGNALRRAHGPGALAQTLVSKLNAEASYGIDSIRHPAEVEALAATSSDFRLIWVEAAAKMRLERIRGRGRPGDPTTLSELARLEGLERRGGDGTTQQLDAVRELADFVLTNEAGLEQLASALDMILQGEASLS
jgi:dephospho-CoA kinase